MCRYSLITFVTAAATVGCGHQQAAVAQLSTEPAPVAKAEPVQARAPEADDMSPQATE